MSFSTESRTVVRETKAAREALEAKGAFTEANAATHIILALEALIRLQGLNQHLKLEDSFNKGLRS